jgi:hypothetical protein
VPSTSISSAPSRQALAARLSSRSKLSRRTELFAYREDFTKMLLQPQRCRRRSASMRRYAVARELTLQVNQSAAEKMIGRARGFPPEIHAPRAGHSVCTCASRARAVLA